MRNLIQLTVADVRKACIAYIEAGGFGVDVRAEDVVFKLDYEEFEGAEITVRHDGPPDISVRSEGCQG